MRWRKHKAYAHLFYAGSNLLNLQIKFYACRFQYICTAAEAGHFSIAVFRHTGTCCRCYKCRRRGNVEQFCAAAAGTAGIDQVVCLNRHLVCKGAHSHGGPSNLFGGFAFHAQCRKDGPYLSRRSFPRHDLVEDFGGIFLAEVVTVNNFCQRCGYIHRSNLPIWS